MLSVSLIASSLLSPLRFPLTPLFPNILTSLRYLLVIMTSKRSSVNVRQILCLHTGPTITPLSSSRGPLCPKGVCLICQVSRRLPWSLTSMRPSLPVTSAHLLLHLLVQVFSSWRKRTKLFGPVLIFGNLILLRSKTNTLSLSLVRSLTLFKAPKSSQNSTHATPTT